MPGRVPAMGDARAVLAAHDPAATLVSVARAGEGLSGRAFFLTASTGDDVVLACSARPADDWRLRKQVAIYRHLASRAVPVPPVLAIDLSRAVVPFGYTLTGRLQGRTLGEALPGMDRATVARVFGALGEVLGRIHATTFDRFGDVAEGPGGLAAGPVHEIAGACDPAPGPFATWAELHAALVEARLRALAATPFADLVAPVGEWLARHDPLASLAVTPRLLHMDLHAGNVLVDGDRVTGVIDVDEAIAGHDEYDLMRTELAHFRDQDPVHATAFLAAYRRHVPEADGHGDRRRFYEVSRALVWMLSLASDTRRGDAALSTGEQAAPRSRLADLLAGRD